MEIPRGTGREDIKARRQIIKDYYASWCAEHPDKKVWNNSLKAFIHVKFQSINETAGQASISYESTCAVLRLTEILKNAVFVKSKKAKSGDKNQKAFDRMLFLYYDGIRLLAGHQKSTDEYVQYCITAKNKASLGR